ncbi:MAG: decaprenyl-phosphate phosphoribosyltransferase [Acidobacteriota bacterium]
MKDNVFYLILISMRPKQWAKNIAIFAALIFSQTFFVYDHLIKSILSFIIFSLFSGSFYIINDLIDLKKDIKHPIKSKRPIASGRLNKYSALIVSIFILILTGYISFLLNLYFGISLISYLILQILYSFLLKHLAILDVFSIAAGFLIRVVAGALVISVPVSSWLLLCTIFLSLFIALGKRRSELNLLGEEALNHRKSLKDYNIKLLDQMIIIVSASTILAYSLYTLSEETVRKFGTTNLKFSIPFVIYGIFRYLYLLYQKEEGGSPENILVNDKPTIINIILYGITVGIVLYIK